MPKAVEHISNKEKFTIFIASVGVFLSRVPFLGAGYGNDPDGWAVANAAREIALTGSYMASRLPGYPVQELLYSLIWKSGPFGFNLVTAIFSVACFVFFLLILKIFNSGNFILGALAFAFVPVIYVNSTNSMDYIWALAFIFWGGIFYYA